MLYYYFIVINYNNNGSYLAFLPIAVLVLYTLPSSLVN